MEKEKKKKRKKKCILRLARCQQKEREEISFIAPKGVAATRAKRMKMRSFLCRPVRVEG